jgi:hypothetical protein
MKMMKQIMISIFQFNENYELKHSSDMIVDLISN